MGFSYGKVMAATVDGDAESAMFVSHVERYDENQQFVAGNTDGGYGNLQGNSYWKGWYKCQCRDADGYRQPLAFPNTEISALVMSFQSGTKGVSGTAMPGKLTLEIPIESGGAISYRVDFFCHGALSPGAASAADSSVPCPMSVKNAKLLIDDVTISNVDYIRMELESDLCPVCNSSTSGQWKHYAGPLNTKLMWRVQDDDPSNWPSIGSRVTAKVYVTAAKYWYLEWLRIKGVQPMFQDLSAKNRKVTGYVAHADMAASNCTVLGVITNPAGTDVWNS